MCTHIVNKVVPTDVATATFTSAVPDKFTQSIISLPEGWVRYAHPKGRACNYFRHTTLKIITSADILDPGVLANIYAAFEIIRAKMATCPPGFTPDDDIYIELNGERCREPFASYYGVNHRNQVISWPEHINIEEYGFQSVEHIMKFLESKYWEHIGRFPSHHQLSADVVNKTRARFQYDTRRVTGLDCTYDDRVALLKCPGLFLKVQQTILVATLNLERCIDSLLGLGHGYVAHHAFAPYREGASDDEHLRKPTHILDTGIIFTLLLAVLSLLVVLQLPVTNPQDRAPIQDLLEKSFSLAFSSFILSCVFGVLMQVLYSDKFRATIEQMENRVRYRDDPQQMLALEIFLGFPKWLFRLGCVSLVCGVLLLGLTLSHFLVWVPN